MRLTEAKNFCIIVTEAEPGTFIDGTEFVLFLGADTMRIPVCEILLQHGKNSDVLGSVS